MVDPSDPRSKRHGAASALRQWLLVTALVATTLGMAISPTDLAKGISTVMFLSSYALYRRFYPPKPQPKRPTPWEVVGTALGGAFFGAVDGFLLAALLSWTTSYDAGEQAWALSGGCLGVACGVLFPRQLLKVFSLHPV